MTDYPQCAVPATVLRAAQVTPCLRRVTITSPAFRRFPVRGNDHYARLLLPQRGQAEPVLPTTAQWYPELLAMDRTVRPVLRNYTLRAVRPDAAEVDVDFVLHLDGGPASTWAAAAAPGDPVGVIEQGVIFTPDPAVDALLLVADESALPAVCGILEHLPAGHQVQVVLEVPEPADRQTLPGRGRVEVTWLTRADNHERPGRLALAHVQSLTAATERRQAWLAGESRLVTGGRRHLVRLGYDKADISFTGYFKHGQAQYAG